jgi:hypothetical protein
MVDSVQLVQSCGADPDPECLEMPPTVIGGFGPWTDSEPTRAAVDGIIPATMGNQWYGYKSTTTGPVTGGLMSDFLVVLNVPGNNMQAAEGLRRALCQFHSFVAKEAFAGPGMADGTPTDLQDINDFTEADQPSELCPALTNWGVGAMALLVCAGGGLVIRRSRAIA